MKHTFPFHKLLYSDIHCYCCCILLHPSDLITQLLIRCLIAIFQLRASQFAMSPAVQLQIMYPILCVAMFKLCLCKIFHMSSYSGSLITATKLKAEENSAGAPSNYFTLYEQKKRNKSYAVFPSSIITHHLGTIINLVALTSLSTCKFAPPPCYY